MKPDQSQSDRPEVDDLFGDIFGLNARALKTLYKLVLHPRTVFAAARVKNWDGRRFTPSVRLALSIFTLQALFSFFISGEDSSLYTGFMEGWTQAEESTFNSLEEREAAGRSILAQFSASLPFTMLLSHAFMAVLVRVWGAGTNLTERVRLYMLAIAPGLSLALIAIICAPILPDYLQMLSAAMLLAVAALDFSTAWRGGVVAGGRLRRVLKGAVLALCSWLASSIGLVLSFAVATLTFLISGA